MLSKLEVEQVPLPSLRPVSFRPRQQHVVLSSKCRRPRKTKAIRRVVAILPRIDGVVACRGLFFKPGGGVRPSFILHDSGNRAARHCCHDFFDPSEGIALEPVTDTVPHDVSDQGGRHGLPGDGHTTLFLSNLITCDCHGHPIPDGADAGGWPYSIRCRSGRACAIMRPASP